MNCKMMDLNLPREWDRRILKIDYHEIMSSRCDIFKMRFLIRQFTDYKNRLPFFLTEYCFDEIKRLMLNAGSSSWLMVGWRKMDENSNGSEMRGAVAVVVGGCINILESFIQNASPLPESAYSVAIDGPAASGKGTIAKLIAEKKNLVYIDTGAMYRAVGLACINNGIPYNDEEKVNDFLQSIDIRIVNEEAQRILLNTEDVTDKIRTPEVSMVASDVSKHIKVREKLVAMQREMARTGRVIMEGRDIGSVVLPNADLKIFLTASYLERAKRRCLEIYGDMQHYDEVLNDLQIRDRNDSTRANSPLTCTFDAFKIDSTGMTIEDVAEEIMLLMP